MMVSTTNDGFFKESRPPRSARADWKGDQNRDRGENYDGRVDLWKPRIQG